MTSLTATLFLATSLMSAPAAPAPADASLAPLTSAAAAASASDQSAQFVRVIRAPEGSRPAALLPMYAGFIALQGYDGYSTIKALNRGAVEANPLMRGVVKCPVALISIKGVAAAGVVFAAERLWRAKHRKAAVILMAVTGGMMVAVGANNARVLRQVR